MIEFNLFDEILLVRHGECETDPQKENKDLSLTEKGRIQALIAAVAIRRITPHPLSHYEFLITSPYMRTIQTAKCIYDDESKWIVDDRVSERNWGDYRLLSLEEKQAYGQLYSYNNYCYFRPPGGENLEDVQARQIKLLQSLSSIGARSVLLSTHGGFMRAFQHLIENTDFSLRVDQDRTNVLRPIENGAVIRYRIDKEVIYKNIIHPGNDSHFMISRVL